MAEPETPAGGSMASETPVLRPAPPQWALTSRPRPERRSDAFVGRAREASTLAGAVTGVAAGRGAVVLVSGESGIGKTRLVREAMAQAGREGLLTLRSTVVEGDWTPPYRCWTEVLGPAIDQAPAADPAPEWAGALAGLVPAVRDRYPRLPVPGALAPEQERIRLADAVVQCLRALGRHRPLMVILDDIQWADDGSLWLLRQVAPALGGLPVLLVAICRDDVPGKSPELLAALATLRRVEGFTGIALRGLAAADVGEIVADVAGPRVPPDLVRQVADTTRGNPFFVRELSRHLRDAGHLDAGRLAGDVAADVPDSLRQVIEQRVGRLSPEAGRLLRHAAVCTGGFDARLLVEMTGVADDVVLDALDEALAAQLIVPVPGVAERYDFLHALVRRALYDGWSPSRRVRLHRALAEALERIHGERAEFHAAEIAAHYHVSAGLPGAERGVPFALGAARADRGRVAAGQVADWLRVAWDLAAPLPVADQVTIASALAIAEAEAMRLDDVRVTADRTLRLHERAGTPPGEAARFLADLVTSLHDAGADPEDWLPLVHKGLAIVPAGDDVTWARLTLMLPRWEPIVSGRVNGSRWLGSDPRAVAIARASGDERLFARSMQPWDLWDRDETEALIRLAGTWQEPQAVIRALTICGADWLYHHGDFDRARHHFARLLAVAERNGAVVGQADACVRLALIAAASGDVAEARELLDRAASLTTWLGGDHHLHASRWWVTALLTDLEGGDWHPIVGFFAGYLTDPAVSRRTATIDDAGLTALALVRAGRPDDARQLLGSLVDVLRRADARMWLINGAIGFGGEAAWALRDPAWAEVLRERSRAARAAGHGDFPGTSLDLTVARMSVLLGDGPAARAAFAAARETLDHSGQRPLRAMTDLDEAGWLATLGVEPVRRDGLAASAHDRFLALGMAGHAARAAALRAPGGQPGDGQPASTYGLTGREVEVVRLVARGLSDRQIADALFVSPRTVHAHLRNVLGKTGAVNRTGLSVWAVDHGLAGDRRDAAPRD